MRLVARTRMARWQRNGHSGRFGGVNLGALATWRHLKLLAAFPESR